MIVVAIIGMLAAIAIPSFMKSRSEARKSTCVNNLRLIDHAKEQWATTNNKNNGDNCASTDVDDYMKGNTMPACPAGGTRRRHLRRQRHRDESVVHEVGRGTRAVTATISRRPRSPCGRLERTPPIKPEPV
jgi:type II secretory pathway pseudopilin PulG